MKAKIIVAVAIAFLFCIKAASAQDGLTFSRVVLFDIPADSIRSISVPAGKVWKIESVSMASSGSVPSVFMRNAALQNIAFFASPVNSASANFPYWLPAEFSGSFLNNSHSYRCSVSVVEYTITLPLSETRH